MIIESNHSRGLSRGIRSKSESVSESESDCFRSERASAGAQPSLGARASVHSSSSESLFKHQPESLNQSQMTDYSSSESLSESESGESESQSQSQSKIVSDQSASAGALLWGARASASGKDGCVPFSEVVDGRFAGEFYTPEAPGPRNRALFG